MGHFSGGAFTTCDPNGERLIVKRLSCSVGPSAARNVGLQMSTSPWLAILDGDDFFFLVELESCCLGRLIGILLPTIHCKFPRIESAIKLRGRC